MKTTVATLVALAVTLVTLGAAQAAPAAMSRDDIANLASASVGYSYWWGHGRWRMDGEQRGSCSGSCPGCSHSGSYGADCSGMVGKAWQVPGPSPVTTDSHPYSTYNFRNQQTHWTRINRDTSEKSDALVYNTNGAGHIVLYERRSDWGHVTAWECKGCSYGCVHNVRSIGTNYIAIRRSNLSSSSTGGGTTGGSVGTIQGVVFEDVGLGTADMTRRIAGASVRLSDGKSLTASAGDAHFTAEVAAGNVTVSVSATGFQSASRTCAVAVSGDTWCSVGLRRTSSSSGGSTGGGSTGGSSSMGSGGGGDAGEDSSGSSMGSSSGSTGGGGTGTGGHGGFDPNAPRGLVRGYVVELNDEFDDLDACDGPRIGGAEVSAETGEKTTADGSGFFQFEVIVGEHLLGAKAQGYMNGAAECTVIEGGVVECCIHLVQGLSEDAPQDEPIQVGCSSAGGRGGLLLVPTFLTLLGLALRRRVQSAR
jgi:hypothetical protein